MSRSAIRAGKKTSAALTRHGHKKQVLPRRRSGRPSRPMAEKLRDHILDVATDLFLRAGYGSTSIEAIAQAARISKRTFYHRFSDKAHLFEAVVHRIIEYLHPPADVPLVRGENLHENLNYLAQLMLHAAMTPQAVALHRLIIAESARFPELALIVNDQGGRQEGVRLIAGLLNQYAKSEKLAVKNFDFAAQQFMHMVISIPQRRALGLGMPMTESEIDSWVQDSVNLFLNGCRGFSQPHSKK